MLFLRVLIQDFLFIKLTRQAPPFSLGSQRPTAHQFPAAVVDSGCCLAYKVTFGCLAGYRVQRLGLDFVNLDVEFSHAANVRSPCNRCELTSFDNKFSRACILTLHTSAITVCLYYELWS